MRSISVGRVTAILALLPGLSVTAVPPASAAEGIVVVFQGEAYQDGALSYPCIGSGTVNLAQCSTLTPTGTTTKPFVVTGGNTRNFALSTTVCVGGASEAQGPPKATVRGSVGTCVLKMSGTITGSCRLASGLGTWLLDVVHTLVGALFDGTTAKTFVDVVVVTKSGTYHFLNVGGKAVVTGTVAGGGAFAASVDITAILEPTFLPPDNSCFAKTQTHFTMQGRAVLAIP